jgi:hypothetical protein
MAPTLTIHFIRDSKKSNDDTVHINKGENDYTLSVSMYDAITEKKYKTLIPKKSLHKYVNSLLTLAKYDSDPFNLVQLSAPYYPCFIFERNDLMNTNIRVSIDSLLSFCLETWYPYDDEEDEEEDEEAPENDCYCSH